ncbi:GNAT family N-acetyltransferase [Daejeonella sp.]|uniref:GNAT family N-acetyltransferase n=1 Tax=Daejeonella sp. TaxID=2805397 RepID=UPI0030C105D4
MITFITTDQTLDLRSSELRWGLDRSLCGFEGDDDKDSFHVGYVQDEKLVSIATFHKQPMEGFFGTGYQLRGMVTHPEFQGKGIGNQLLNFSIVYLGGQMANYLWCNSRKIAYKFYQGIGFEFISEEFELPKIGPHRVMYLKIN